MLPSKDFLPASHLAVEQSSATRDSYQVSYRSGNGHALVEGDAGRSAFDTATQQATQGCSGGAYCASGRNSSGGATTEVFRNVTVHGSSAVLKHLVGGPNPGWTLVWYDSATDTSYSLGLSESMGGALLVGGTDPTNVSVGQTVASMAESLTPQTAPKP